MQKQVAMESTSRHSTPGRRVDMSESEKTGLRLPRAKGRVTMRRVSDPVPEADAFPDDLIPFNIGDTWKLGVRFDQRFLDMIQGEIDRLSELTLEVVTRSDAIRSLLRAGTIHFRNQENNEPKND